MYKLVDISGNTFVLYFICKSLTSMIW